MPAFFVVNPTSAGGRTAREWERHREEILQPFPDAGFALTTGPGHAKELALAAAAGGASLVVAMGGDGTVNEVVNGLMAAPARPVLGIIPSGSGSDFARALDIPRNVREAATVLQSSRTATVDIGEIEFVGAGGEPVRRHFVNMAGCGASADVVRRTLRIRPLVGGALGYLAASLATTIAQRMPRVEIQVDRAAPRVVPLNVLFVCNGEFCGGAMRVGRGAIIDDGLFQVVEVAGVGRLRSLLNAPKLYNGGLEGIPGVQVYSARTVRVTAVDEVLLDCDGEQPGRLPATYRVIPAALRVRVPGR